MKQWMCPSCHRRGTLIADRSAETLEVDIRNMTVILEDPRRTWSFLCSSLNTLKQLSQNESEIRFDAQIKRVSKMLNHLMAMFIEEQRGNVVPLKDCGCNEQDT